MTGKLDCSDAAHHTSRQLASALTPERWDSSPQCQSIVWIFWSPPETESVYESIVVPINVYLFGVVSGVEVGRLRPCIQYVRSTCAIPSLTTIHRPTELRWIIEQGPHSSEGNAKERM